MTVTVTERLAGTRSGSIDPTGARTLTREFDIVGTDVLQTAIASMDAEVEIGHTYAIGVNSAGFNVRATYYGQKSWTRPEGVNSHWIFHNHIFNSPKCKLWHNRKRCTDHHTRGFKRYNQRGVPKISKHREC